MAKDTQNANSQLKAMVESLATELKSLKDDNKMLTQEVLKKLDTILVTLSQKSSRKKEEPKSDGTTNENQQRRFPTNTISWISLKLGATSTEAKAFKAEFFSDAQIKELDKYLAEDKDASKTQGDARRKVELNYIVNNFINTDKNLKANLKLKFEAETAAEEQNAKNTLKKDAE